MADVQVRFENGALAYFPTVKEAMEKADNNPTIWKISFDTPWGERIRLVKKEFPQKDPGVWVIFWIYEPLDAHGNEIVIQLKEEDFPYPSKETVD